METSVVIETLRANENADISQDIYPLWEALLHPLIKLWLPLELISEIHGSS